MEHKINDRWTLTTDANNWILTEKIPSDGKLSTKGKNKGQIKPDAFRSHYFGNPSQALSYLLEEEIKCAPLSKAVAHLDKCKAVIVKAVNEWRRETQT